MNRKVRTFLVALGVAVAGLGLTAVPAQAVPVTEICNSAASVGGNWPDTENYLEITDPQYNPWIRGRLRQGQCKSFTNTSTLRVSLYGYYSWRVRNRGPGGYGSCHTTELSNPAAKSGYIYLGFRSHNANCTN